MASFCKNNFFLLCGVINGANGLVSNVSISYTVDGRSATTTTDANGEYCIHVPRCASVVISANPLLGVTSTPARYAFDPVCSDLFNLNFTLAPLVAESAMLNRNIARTPSVTPIMPPVSRRAVSSTLATVPSMRR